MSTIPIDDRIQAIRWKLGLPSGGEDTVHLSKVWDRLAADPSELDGLARQVARRLADPLAAALAAKLTDRPSPHHEWAREMAERYLTWVRERQDVRSMKLAELIRVALEAPPPARVTPPPPKPSGLHPDAGRLQRPPEPRPLTPPPPPKPSGLHPDAGRSPRPPEPRAVTPPDPPPPVPLPPPATWRHQPVPAAPEPFPEWIADTFANTPPGFRGFAARVRGKKHKHDGSNCDDWFAFDRSGDWTVLAVADGAGSKRLSRVGARTATSAAVVDLIETLTFRTPAARPSHAEWAAALTPTADGRFPDDDIEAVREALVGAMRKAHERVEEEAAARAADPAYNDPAGRPAEVGDLACTLLLAVLQPVAVDGKPRHLVMTCQVGDGMIGVVHRNGTAFQVGAADSGSHAGETEFLTSGGKTATDFLARKTAGSLLDLQALLVMTDGVADDYFPGGDHLGRLWADLVVNGIPDLLPPSGDPPPEVVAVGEYGTPVEVVEPDPRTRVTLHSSQALADRLGTTVGELVQRPAALWAGRRPLPGGTAADRLRLWLDAYHVRGSFDDRTLVCVHREDLA